MKRDEALRRDADLALLPPEAAAECLKCKVETLRAWRRKGVGPVYVRIGGMIRYLRSDIQLYIRAQRTLPGQTKEVSLGQMNDAGGYQGA